MDPHPLSFARLANRHRGQLLLDPADIAKVLRKPEPAKVSRGFVRRILFSYDYLLPIEVCVWASFLAPSEEEER